MLILQRLHYSCCRSYRHKVTAGLSRPNVPYGRARDPGMYRDPSNVQGSPELDTTEKVTDT